MSGRAYGKIDGPQGDLTIRTDAPRWSVTVEIASDQLWELPNYNGSKTARFIPEQLTVTWKTPAWDGASTIFVSLRGQRRTVRGTASSGSMIYVRWSYEPSRGWRNDFHGPHSLPDTIRKFVEANTPPGLKLEP